VVKNFYDHHSRADTITIGDTQPRSLLWALWDKRFELRGLRLNGERLRLPPIPLAKTTGCPREAHRQDYFAGVFEPFTRWSCAPACSISAGWEIYLGATSEVTPGNVGYYAIKAVASRRWMQGSVRCPSFTPSSTRPNAYQFDFDDYYSTNDNPARIAAMRIDFNEWLEGLSDRQRDLVTLLATGESTADAAQKIGCTPGNISQYRRRLAESWYRYQS